MELLFDIISARFPPRDLLMRTNLLVSASTKILFQQTSLSTTSRLFHANALFSRAFSWSKNNFYFPEKKTHISHPRLPEQARFSNLQFSSRASSSRSSAFTDAQKKTYFCFAGLISCIIECSKNKTSCEGRRAREGIVPGFGGHAVILEIFNVLLDEFFVYIRHSLIERSWIMRVNGDLREGK